MGKTSFLVAVYLAAIVLANLSIAHWGTQAAIYNAFLFIGLDFTTRDTLHDAWRGHLLRNMATLIGAGAVLSYLLGIWLGSAFPGGPSVGRIALASCIAFGAAAITDSIAYHLLRKRTWYERANQSNLAGAAVDSIVFPIAAFGLPVPYSLIFGLWCAKVAGGVVWSFLLGKNADGKAWLARSHSAYGES